jgi:MraZ protein
MRGTADVEPDGKLGRMTIPKALLEKAGIEKEVVFAGSNHMIEIWDKEKYEAKEMESRDFVALAEKILG